MKLSAKRLLKAAIAGAPLAFDSRDLADRQLVQVIIMVVSLRR
jgi:hypothetical protein